jgi:ParB family chromosome partitioning protein
MSDASRKKGLGRGLAALIDEVRPPAEAPPRAPDSLVPLDLIRPNPDQPRKRFDDEALEELAQSIRLKGIIQPLIVRPDPERPGGWQIVAGERRWRAAQRAPVHRVPVIVRELTDQEVLEVAILENVQRADLNPIEEGAGYAQLIDRFAYTQEQLASVIGKSRSHIANAMRLLSLPEEVQAMARDGRLSAGHARALITARDPLGLARRILAEGLSVRETERLAKAPAPPPPAVRRPRVSDADTRALEGDLSAVLGVKVEIRHRGDGGGELRLRYRDLDQLDGLCRLLSK